MIQGILAFQYALNETEEGEIQPEFKPMQLIFNNDKLNKDDYSELLIENDIFALFYEHSTGLHPGIGDYSNFYTGRLNETSYQVISYYKQFGDGSRFLTISIFDLYDELELFEPFIKNNAERLDIIYKTYITTFLVLSEVVLHSS